MAVYKRIIDFAGILKLDLSSAASISNYELSGGKNNLEPSNSKSVQVLIKKGLWYLYGHERTIEGHEHNDQTVPRQVT